MRLGLILSLSLAGLFLLAGSLLADDRVPTEKAHSMPDTSLVSPISLIGVTRKFSLEKGLEEKPSPLRSVILSTTMPGLGQLHNGHWLKGASFVIVGALLVAKVLVEKDRADRYLHLSKTVPDEDDAAYYYDRYSFHFDQKDRYLWWMLGFWVYNMLDAYVDGHLFGFSRQ